VVVDDGSTDATRSLLEAWSDRLPGLVVESPGRIGLVAALNRGLGSCRADFVARMDADDIAHPRRLEKQLEMLRSHPDFDVVSCLVRCFPRSTVAAGFRLYEQWLNSLVDHEAMTRQRFVESPVAHPSVMFRRRAVTDAGGYQDRGWPEDYHLWLRLFAAGSRFGKVNSMLYFWRDHAQRLTRVDPRYRVASFIDCKAFHLAEGPLRNAQSVILWGAGRTGRRLSGQLIKLGIPVTAFIDIDPRLIGRTVRDRPVCRPSEAGSLAARPGTVILAAVASRGARELIEKQLLAFGLVEGENFWCVA